MATTLTADLSIEPSDTTPCLETCPDDGYYSLALGNQTVEVKLIGTLDTLYEILDNCRAALDSLPKSCRQVGT